jgi:hypothetical protein
LTEGWTRDPTTRRALLREALEYLAFIAGGLLVIAFLSLDGVH